MPACKRCGTTYEVKSIDDSYCSDDCWEAANCEEPKPEEVMEEEFA